MLVVDILRDKGNTVFTVEPGTAALAAAQTMVKRRVGALLVRSGTGPVAGIVSERDIVVGLAARGVEAATSTVADLMTPASDLVTCAPTDSIAHIMAIMTDRRVRHLPVMEGGRLTGIVSIGDVVKARIRETLAEVEAMTAYVRG